MNDKSQMNCSTFCKNPYCARKQYLNQQVMIYEKNLAAKKGSEAKFSEKVKDLLSSHPCSKPTGPGSICYPAMSIFFANQQLVTEKA